MTQRKKTQCISLNLWASLPAEIPSGPGPVHLSQSVVAADWPYFPRGCTTKRYIE